MKKYRITTSEGTFEITTDEGPADGSTGRVPQQNPGEIHAQPNQYPTIDAIRNNPVVQDLSNIAGAAKDTIVGGVSGAYHAITDPSSDYEKEHPLPYLLGVGRRLFAGESQRNAADAGRAEELQRIKDGRLLPNMSEVGHAVEAMPVVGPMVTGAKAEYEKRGLPGVIGTGIGIYAGGKATEAGIGAVGDAVSKNLSPESLRGKATKVEAVRDSAAGPGGRKLLQAAGAGVGGAIGYKVSPGPIGAPAGAAYGGYLADSIFKGATTMTAEGLKKLAAARERMGAPHFDNAALDRPTPPSYEAAPAEPIVDPAARTNLSIDTLDRKNSLEVNRVNQLEDMRAETAATAAAKGTDTPFDPVLDKPIPGVSPDIEMAREALMENGAPRTVKNLETAGQNADYLLKEVPELRGLKPGTQFNTRLYNAFDITGNKLNAAEDSIPDNKAVATKPYAEEVQAVIDAAPKFKNEATLKAANDLKNFLETGTVTWDEFIKNKRAFFKKVKLTDPMAKAVYDIMQQISDDVSPDLTPLNRRWFTLKHSMDLAAISPFSGEKLIELRKAQVAAQKARGK